MAKNKAQKKSTKGIPRITAAVLAMDAAAQSTWVDGLMIVGTTTPLSDEQKADVRARLSKAVIKPRKTRSLNWSETFAGRTAEDLAAANTALKTALVGAKSQMEQDIANLVMQIEQKKAALAASQVSEPVTA
jgi:hypothetical protein